MKAFPYTDIEAEEYPGLDGVTIRWAIGENVDAPNFIMRIIELEPGSATGYHEHAWEHEVFVLAGTGSVRDANGLTPIGPGSCVYVEPDEIHQFINEGTDNLRFICVIPRV